MRWRIWLAITRVRANVRMRITERAQTWLRDHGYIVLIPISRDHTGVSIREPSPFENGLFVTDNDFDERMIRIRLFSRRAYMKLGATIQPEIARELARELIDAATIIESRRGGRVR